MSSAELESIQRELAISGRQAQRNAFLVSKVRRVLWPFVRSYHFLTLAWAQKKFDQQRGEIQQLQSKLDAHDHLMQRVSERQRAMQAETLAMSRQNADLRAMLEARTHETIAEWSAVIQEHSAQLSRLSRQQDDSASIRLAGRAGSERFSISLPIGHAVFCQTSHGLMVLRACDLITEAIVSQGGWDTHLLPWIERGARRGSVAVDAGAHFGSLSCAMATHFETVYSFEANSANYAYLCANAFLRPEGRIVPRNLGLYSKSITISLAQPEDQEVVLDPSRGIEDAFRNVANSGGLVFSPNGTGVSMVEAIALDSLGLQDVGFIKVDCQGSDGHVILGAMDTIRRCRPIVVFEWEELLSRSHGVALSTVREQLEAAGYTVEVARQHNEKQIDYVAIPRD